MSRVALRALLIAAHVVTLSSAALSNGRFPRAQRLIEVPGDPARLTVAATYGLLQTADRGHSWSHVCEAAFAEKASYQGDPLIAWLDDQTLLVGIQSGLNVSRDGGCSFSRALGAAGEWVPDFTVSRAGPATVVAIVTKYVDGVTNTLAMSTDGAKTWTPMGSRLPVVTALTVDLDPVDPARVYATGIANGLGVFLRSNDRGATWTSSPIPGTGTSAAPYIAAVHPTDPKQIFVRTDAWITDNDRVANDALLHSRDGGTTWSVVFQSQAKMYGFALSPDASTVLVGLGDPTEGVVPGPLGVFQSPTDRFAFEQVFDGHIGCLTWTGRGIYVCTSQYYEKFELAFSAAPLSSSGSCLEPILRLDQVRGTLACGATATACDWPTDCQVLGACGDGDATEADAARGCGTSDAGGGQVFTDAGRGPDAGGGPPVEEAGTATSESTSSRCSIGVPRSRAPHFGLQAVAALAIACWSRRRIRIRMPVRGVRRQELGGA